jgi:hypothetical protein
MLNPEPLVGITIAIGDWASTTLLHLGSRSSNDVRYQIIDKQETTQVQGSITKLLKGFLPVKREGFIATKYEILTSSSGKGEQRINKKK